MDINDLHDLRDGTSIRRRRAFNPFIHVAVDTPLMRMLFSITRPPQEQRVTRKPLVRSAKKKVPASSLPGGSMVSYGKERPKP